MAGAVVGALVLAAALAAIVSFFVLRRQRRLERYAISHWCDDCDGKYPAPPVDKVNTLLLHPVPPSLFRVYTVRLIARSTKTILIAMLEYCMRWFLNMEDRKPADQGAMSGLW